MFGIKMATIWKPTNSKWRQAWTISYNFFYFFQKWSKVAIVWISSGPDHLKIKQNGYLQSKFQTPFEFRSDPHHLNTDHIWYSSPTVVYGKTSGYRKKLTDILCQAVSFGDACESLERKYSGDLNTDHLNNKLFEVWISNGSALGCLVFKWHLNTGPSGIQPLFNKFEYQTSRNSDPHCNGK